MTLISRLDRTYQLPQEMKQPPFYKLWLWALAEWIETKIPAGWKYQLLRRWLTYEMIATGWVQEHGNEGRLTRTECDGIFRVNMADHEAVSRHFKEFPLREKAKTPEPIA